MCVAISSVVMIKNKFRMRKPKWMKNFTHIASLTTALMLSVNAHADFVLGDNQAPITIIEYGSLTCDYCVKFHREVLPLIKLRHIKKGGVRFIFRNFPTSVEGTRGAVAARCAGPDQYYVMLDSLFKTVGDWSRANDVDAALVEHATSIGLNDETFLDCLNDPQQTLNIKNEQEKVVYEYDVRGTPTFLINKNVVRGIQDIHEIEKLIDEAQLGEN